LVFLLYALVIWFARETVWSKGRVLMLTFMYPCFISIIVNDDQQDANIWAYLFSPNQLIRNK